MYAFHSASSPASTSSTEYPTGVSSSRTICGSVRPPMLYPWMDPVSP